MSKAGSLNCTSTVLTYALGSELIRGPLRVKARAGNTGNVYIGGDDVTKSANGCQLSKGEYLDIDYVVDVANVYAAAETANDKVDWISLSFDD